MNYLLLNQQGNISDPRQISHIKQVLKAQVGDVLKVGIKNGRLGQAYVVGFDDNTIRLGDVVLDTDPPPKAMTVVLALPRPKVLRRLIMDMTAFGVAHIVLMNSYRTEKSYWQSPMLDKIDDFIWEGLQQGGDTIAPKVTLAKRFKPFVQDELPYYPAPLLLAHPYANTPVGDYHTKPQTLIIGAEGGFIPYEVDAMVNSGAIAVSLGLRILRTESAVSALLGRFL